MSAFLPHALRYVSDGEKNEFVENSVFEKRKPNKSLNPSGFRRNICIGLYFILFHFIVSLSLSPDSFLTRIQLDIIFLSILLLCYLLI